MARKDIDRFISSVNGDAGQKEAPIVSQRGAGRSVSPTSKQSARSATSSTGVEVLQEGPTVHVPVDSEERRLDARCVLDLPGYRENKVRTLLFKNNELEQTLKEERANVRRLVRANDALEKQVIELVPVPVATRKLVRDALTPENLRQLLQLNAARSLPRSAPALATHNAWSEANLDKGKQVEAAQAQGGAQQV